MLAGLVSLLGILADPVISYRIALLVVLAACIRLGRGGMVSAAMVLIGNYAINTMVTGAPNDPPWPIYLGVDYLSALLLIIHRDRPNRWHLVIAGTYVVQCIAHGAYGASNQDPWADYYYWHVLSKIAWAQLAVMGGWCAVDLYRRWRVHAGGRAPGIAHHRGGKS